LKATSTKKKDYILLAEDDSDDQEMLIEAIKECSLSFEFQIANTGSKTLEMLKNCSSDKMPCLIILDYNLPEMSGAEILARLHDMKQFEKVIKVVWSTSNSPVYQKKCMDLGAHSYIVKPTGMAGIRKVAKEMVELCQKTSR
jgi:CheY-like chemotaxis protein